MGESTAVAIRSNFDLTAKVEELRNKKFNILLPTTTFASQSELYVPRLDIVTPEGIKGGDFYAQGNKNIGTKDKEVWVKPMAPSAQFLSKVASAANIQWHPDKSCHTLIEKMRVVYKAVAAIRQADGSWRIITDEYELDLEVIEEELTVDYNKKARFDDFQKRMKKEFMTVDDYIRRDLLQKRKHKLALASTGAMNRVIRKALTLKNTYLPDEANKPFAIAKFDFQPDFNDPTVRRYASMAAVRAQNDLFGGGGLEMPLDAMPDEEKAAGEFGDNGTGKVIDIESSEYGDNADGPDDMGRFVDGAAEDPPWGDMIFCQNCGEEIQGNDKWTPETIRDYSVRNFGGKVYCPNCQREAKAGRIAS